MHVYRIDSGQLFCKCTNSDPFTPTHEEILHFRLQTGMRGAFGKPQGTVARVHIGQPIMSVRCKDNHKAVAIEALRRAKFKFPGRQKVFIQILALTNCI